jgi:uncharacterized repeat protein (TIGR01451 family)
MKNVSTVLITLLLTFFSHAGYGQWTQLQGPQGGECITTARVGTAIWEGTTSGIYTSADNGLTWHKSSLLNNAWCASIYSQGDTSIIVYSAANTQYTSYDSMQSIRSLDGGQTWSSPITFPSIGYSELSNVVIQSRNTLLYEVSNGPFTVTYDYGNTWANIQAPSQSLIDVKAYDTVALAEVYNDYSGYISYYTSTDGMLTWQYLDSNEHYGSGYSNDSVMMIELNASSPSTPNKILRSTNQGQTWDTVLQVSYNDYLAYFVSFAGAIYVYEGDSASNPFFYKSKDAGKTWTGPIPFYSLPPIINLGSVYIGNAEYLGPGPLGMVIYDTIRNEWFSDNTGMLSPSVNGVYAINSTIYAALSDNLYVSSDGGGTWSVSPAALANATVMLSSGDTIFAGSNTALAWSYDNGISWMHRGGFSDSTSYDASPNSLIIVNGRIIYSGAAGMAYTDDYGQTWDTLPPLPDNYNPFGPITAFENKLLTVTNDGTIYNYNNGTNIWDSISAFYSPGAGNSNRIIALDSILLLTGRNIFARSYDRGMTWTPSPFTGIPTFQAGFPCVISVQGLWIGQGDTSIYVSSDSGSSWTQIQSGGLPFMAFTGINTLAIRNNVLYAATAYSGIWRRAGAFASISGTVYRDLNNNGIQDAGEPGMAGVVLSTWPDGMLASTDSAGHYTMITDEVGDSLLPVAPISYISFTPSSYITTGMAATNVNFGVTIPSGIHDLSTDITATRHFEWSQLNNNFELTVLNKGSQPQVATLTLVLDGGMTYGTASPAPAYISTNNDTLVWTTGTLDLLQRYHATVTVNTNGTIGSYVACHSVVTPVINDTLPADNYASLLDSVVGPFDPNSKECAQGSYITPQQVAQSQKMVYTIRFQNDGNAPAANIKISDTLSTYFDAKTFQIVSSSFPVSYHMSRQNVVDFYFDNINLPPASQNSAASCGYVKYSLDCKNDLGLGNAIANTANIYFDNNSAVVTNEALTIVATQSLPAGVLTIDQQATVKVYPNPVSDILHIDLTQMTGTENTIAIYDQLGRILTSQAAGSEIASIHVNDLVDGIYVGKISQDGILKASFRFVLNK